MKNCPNCNTANDDASVYCSGCGQQLDGVAATGETADLSQPAAESADFSPSAADTAASANNILNTVLNYAKKYAKFVIAGVAALLVIIIAVNLFQPDQYQLAEHSMDYFRKDGETVIVFDGKDPVKLEGSPSIHLNAHNSACLLLDDDGTLSYLKIGDKKPKKIASDVDQCQLSNVNDRYFFISKEESILYTGQLGKSPKKVSADVVYFTVSLDGKTVAYQTSDEKQFIYDGKSKELDISKEARVNIISDGAKYIYYTKSGSAYVLKNQKNETKLGESVSIEAVNRNGSQVLYLKNGATYLSKDGKEGVKLLNQFSELVFPLHAVSAENLIGCIVRGENGIYCLGKNEDKTVKIGPSTASGIVMAEDGKSLVYRNKSDEVVRLTNLKKETEDPKVLTKDFNIRSISYSNSLKKFCFVDNEGDLYYVSGNSKPKKIDYDITRVYPGAGEGEFFVEKDSTLYYTKNGSKLKKVDGIGDDGFSLYRAKKFVICETNDAYYRCTSGKKFKKICDK